MENMLNSRKKRENIIISYIVQKFCNLALNFRNWIIPF